LGLGFDFGACYHIPFAGRLLSVHRGGLEAMEWLSAGKRAGAGLEDAVLGGRGWEHDERVGQVR